MIGLGGVRNGEVKCRVNIDTIFEKEIVDENYSVLRVTGLFLAGLFFSQPTFPR